MMTTRVLCAISTTAVLFAGNLAVGQHAPARITDANPDQAVAIAAVPAAPAPQETPAKTEEKKLLTIGDKAPTPVMAKIFKGNTDFKRFKDGKVYVMEFWATWCGPCKSGMPHVTELQKKYADQGVEIIGCAIWQQEKTQAEREKTVSDFIAIPEWDKKTGYTIAIDDESKTSTMFMRAAGENGIPCAFIVGKDGIIEWIGHPMTMDEPLAKVVAGSWNREEAKKEIMKEKQAEMVARKLRNDMRAAQQAGDYPKMITLLDSELAKNPDDLNMMVQKFQLMIGPMNDSEGYGVGWDMLKKNRDNSQLLNMLAWYTLDDEAVQDRDLEFAMAAAKAANEASGGNNPAVLDTLARAYYEMGNFAKAVKVQKKAVEFAGDDAMGEDIRKTLEKYEMKAKGSSV
jgi:thiol-disulfide isomerase/thioredoxin